MLLGTHMKRLLVNDLLSALPDHRTFWHDLQEWFGCEFVGGDYATLADEADEALDFFLDDGYAGDDWPRLAIRNASYFPPMKHSKSVPTISLLQDIFDAGPQREMQEAVIKSSRSVIFNSAFSESKYHCMEVNRAIIPLPVDFTLFQPG